MKYLSDSKHPKLESIELVEQTYDGKLIGYRCPECNGCGVIYDDGRDHTCTVCSKGTIDLDDNRVESTFHG